MSLLFGRIEAFSIGNLRKKLFQGLNTLAETMATLKQDTPTDQYGKLLQHNIVQIMPQAESMFLAIYLIYSMPKIQGVRRKLPNVDADGDYFDSTKALPSDPWQLTYDVFKEYIEFVVGLLVEANVKTVAELPIE